MFKIFIANSIAFTSFANAVRVNDPTKKVCSFYTKGKCTKGDDCTFHHPPCTFFLQGTCTKPDCKWDHPQTTNANTTHGAQRDGNSAMQTDAAQETTATMTHEFDSQFEELDAVPRAILNEVDEYFESTFGDMINTQRHHDSMLFHIEKARFSTVKKVKAAFSNILFESEEDGQLWQVHLDSEGRGWIGARFLRAAKPGKKLIINPDQRNLPQTTNANTTHGAQRDGNSAMQTDAAQETTVIKNFWAIKNEVSEYFERTFGNMFTVDSDHDSSFFHLDDKSLRTIKTLKKVRDAFSNILFESEEDGQLWQVHVHSERRGWIGARFLRVEKKIGENTNKN